MNTTIAIFIKVAITTIILVSLFIGITYKALQNKNTHHENMLQNYQIQTR